MATHSPLDKLHEHLDKAAAHRARVHEEATKAVQAHNDRRALETQNSVSETLTGKGQ